MALDIQKPKGRRLRVRVDIYRPKPDRRFAPVKRQAIVFNVADRAEHRAMFRGLTNYLKSEAWRKDVRPDDNEGEDD